MTSHSNLLRLLTWRFTHDAYRKQLTLFSRANTAVQKSCPNQVGHACTTDYVRPMHASSLEISFSVDRQIARVAGFRRLLHV